MTHQSHPFLQWLEKENGYTAVRLLSDGRWAALTKMTFTTAIIVGKVSDRWGYDDRWCYHDPVVALAALNAWDGTGEPLGWHRHPRSGRRVTEEGEEYFAP
jgi:hypothetical protein